MDDLVTRDYLDVRLGEFDTKLEKHFSAVDTRFASIDVKLTEIDGKITLVFWMLGIVIASTTVPQLISLFGS